MPGMRLPEPAGPFAVGATTFSHPVQREVFSESKLSNGEHSLVMEEVLYNVYYPCEISRKDASAYASVPWLLRYGHDRTRAR